MPILWVVSLRDMPKEPFFIARPEAVMSLVTFIGPLDATLDVLIAVAFNTIKWDLGPPVVSWVLNPCLYLW